MFRVQDVGIRMHRLLRAQKKRNWSTHAKFSSGERVQSKSNGDRKHLIFEGLRDDAPFVKG